MHAFIFLFIQFSLMSGITDSPLCKSIGIRILSLVLCCLFCLVGRVLFDTQLAYLSTPLWFMTVLWLPPLDVVLQQFTASWMTLAFSDEVAEFLAVQRLHWLMMNYSSSIRKTQMIKSYSPSCTTWIYNLYHGMCSYFTNKTIPYIHNRTIKSHSFIPSRLCWYLKSVYFPPCQAP